MRTSHNHPFRPALEALEQRALMTVTATYYAAYDYLYVAGDAADNTITVTVNNAGAISVTSNGQAVAITGGVANTGNTNFVKIRGLDGHDRLTLNGNLEAWIFGDNGNDTLQG